MITILFVLIAIAVLCMALAPHVSKPVTSRFLGYAAGGIALAVIVIVLVAARHL